MTGLPCSRRPELREREKRSKARANSSGLIFTRGRVSLLPPLRRDPRGVKWPRRIAEARRSSCIRRGILTSYFLLQMITAFDDAPSKLPCDLPMNRRNRKQRKPGRFTRREARAARAKRRKGRKKNKAKRASTPWLTFVPGSFQAPESWLKNPG